MRALPFIGALGAAMLGIGIAQAEVAPAALDRTLASGRGPIVMAQLHCDHLRCINLRTGAYTHSNCNRQGCYPSGGVVGRTDPHSLGLGYGSDYPSGDYRWRHQRRRDWDRYYGD